MYFFQVSFHLLWYILTFCLVGVSVAKKDAVKISHFGGFLTLLKIFLVFILLCTYRSINITLFERYEFYLMIFDFYLHVLSLSCLILGT